MSEPWQPTCSLDKLRLRAQLLAAIRDFFAARGVLEVETPLLADAIGTDPQLDFFTTQLAANPAQALYLQTSPEFAMKRLLAAGSGSIYQICKAFRQGEIGRLHNPEFTLLEWYSVGFDLHALMAEVEALFAVLLGSQWQAECAQRVTYQAIFQCYTGLDALAFDLALYTAYAQQHALHDALRLCGDEHALWLDFLFSHQVQPHLGAEGLVQVYAYPACQAALARINPTDARVADRVELFWRGIEIGNGYFELDDAQEQARRFQAEQTYRSAQGLPEVAIDYKFLAALHAGLPRCAGMAIGLDRLLLLLSASASLAEVLAFPLRRD